MLTTAQVNWARGHDWFLADLGDGFIYVLDRSVDIDGKAKEEAFVWVHSFAALKDWAGY